jgi:hypothetical protein
MLAGDEHCEWLAQNLQLAWIEHSLVRQIVAKRVEAHQNQSWLGVPTLLQECGSEAAQQLITRAVAESLSNEDLGKNLMETVLRVRNDFIERELKLLTQRRLQAGLTDDEGVEIEKRKMELRRLKSQALHHEPAFP